MSQVYFNMETQRYVYGGDHTEILFDDEAQSIGHEECTDDGYISWETEIIVDKKEYFKRKLMGK